MTVLPIHDPVQVFALVMLVILGVPLACRLTHLPVAFGLIVAGVILGPHTLNVLERDATLSLLGTVGLHYIMFQIGLEIDLHLFVRHRRDSAVFGIATCVVPLLLGVAAGTLLLALPFLPALLLGSMLASHTLLTFPSVSRLGLARTPVVTATVGGTVLTDGAALVILAAIAATAHGSTGPAFWLRFLASALGATVLVVWGLPRLGRWFLRTAATDDTVEYTFALASVFACAALLQAAGIEPMIGALLAGLALNRLIPENGVLMNRIRFVGNALFVPFFLISVGMLVDIWLPMASATAAAVAVVMALTAVASKWLAADVSRRVLGLSRDEGGLMFGLSVNRAATALAAVMVGFEVGLFSEAVVTGAVVMILVTCSVGAWLTDRYGLRCARSLAQQPAAGVTTAERILVPVANPATADRLIALALLLRQPGSHEPIYPMAVVQESHGDTPGAVAAAEQMLGSVVVHAVAAQAPVVPITRVELNVATGIARAMTDFRASMAVIGWTGSGSSLQRVFGRVLDHLLEQSHQMLLVYRATSPISTVRRLIVLVPPLVERQAGFGAVRHSLDRLAAQLGARVTILQAGGFDETWRGGARSRSRETRQPLASWSAAVPTMAALNPGSADALVLVSARRGGLGWQPMLDRLPRLLADRFRESNLVVAYPPEEPPPLALASMVDSPEPRTGEGPLLVAPDDVLVNLDSPDPEAALASLLARAFAGAPEAVAGAVASAREGGALQPLELTPGVVLLHARLEAAGGSAGSRVLVGTRQQGIPVSGCTERAQCVLLVLSRADQPPEVHLQALAALARCLRDPGRRARLRTAQTAADVVAAFR